jgi:arylsulfatase A-like enzyme
LDDSSFADVLRSPHDTRDTEIFAELDPSGPHAGYMIRAGDFKCCCYRNDTPRLYDLRTDPDEMKNLGQLPDCKKRAQ